MGKQSFKGPLERVDEHCWRIPRSYKPGMRVDGLIYADEAMIRTIRGDQAPEQVANVAFLPGIQRASLAMPDIHWGYGFTIGGVCATDPEQGGVISPGGVGYDINCGVRLVRTRLHEQDVRPRIRQLVEALFGRIPLGVGRSGPYRFDTGQLKQLMAEGPAYLLRRGWATDRDIEFTENGGCLSGAEPDLLSERALQRGEDQCGTLGSGNHFLEVQVVERIFDPAAAAAMGLEPGQICVFYRSAAGDRLKLVASKGLPRSITDQDTHVMFSDGRIGWVAEHQMVMGGRDFVSASSFRGESAAISSRFNVDLCAAMVDTDDSETMGVITVGAPGRYPSSEKKMIKMVADLGSMGIKNAEYHQRIQSQANEDSLTGLHNKRFGTDKLALAINRAEKNGETLAVFMLDIDHFKNYNDTNGHLAGDDVLRRVGEIMRGALRADDFGVRFGGRFDARFWGVG